ncbi:hypothetical protein AMECASPLE_009072, partial [Ameca splendens]
LHYREKARVEEERHEEGKQERVFNLLSTGEHWEKRGSATEAESSASEVTTKGGRCRGDLGCDIMWRQKEMKPLGRGSTRP